MTGDTLLSRVIDPAMGIIVPRKLGQALRMSVADLSKVVGINRNTLSANAASKRVQARLQEVVAIITAMIAVRGDEARAIIFFRHHRISRFGDRTPAELVAEGMAADVLAYINAFVAGAPL